MFDTRKRADTTKQTPEERLSELLGIKKPLKCEAKKDFNKSQALGVPMDSYGVTSASSPQPIVGTWGAGPCLIVGLHDPSTLTVITHSCNEKPQFLSNFLDNMNLPTVEAHLTGTFLMFEKKSPQSMVLETYYFLQDYGVKIMNTDIARGELTRWRIDEHGPTSLAIDSRTGKVYSSLSNSDFDILSKRKIADIDSDFSFRIKKPGEEKKSLGDERLKQSAASLVNMTAIPKAVVTSAPKVAKPISNEQPSNRISNLFDML